MKLKGIGASNGIAFGKVWELKELDLTIKNTKIESNQIDSEILKLNDAVQKTISEINVIKEKASTNLSSEELAVFDAHIQVASDPMMIDESKSLITSSLMSAEAATEKITNNYIQMFENMDDAYMKERASDIKDVAKRIIKNLLGLTESNLSDINEDVVIVANDLTPSDTAQLNKQFVKGFVTNIGGRTSHAAIMARSLEIPAVLGLKDITSKVQNGDIIALDGSTGEIIINPTASELDEVKAKQLSEAQEKALNQSFKGKATLTNDSHEVELAANIGSPNDVHGVLENDAQAVGLFRSEFLYMDAKSWPTEEEQYKAYSKVVESMNGKMVIVRTLDIGGDKELPYFDFPKEMNPFLGYRAIRLCLDKKDIFQTQLRALLRASVHGKLGIMFPMIATIDEFLAAKEELEKAKSELKSQNIAFSNDIQVGMMVEIPSAAVLASEFAKHSDFFSIGTNDLMQYTMAADRMSEKVSYLYQPLNPSILRMIKMTIDGAHSQNKWVGMCGEMAGDASVIPLLVGMGLDEFSMSASSILPARRQIASLNYEATKELALKALNCQNQAQVQELLDNFK